MDAKKIKAITGKVLLKIKPSKKEEDDVKKTIQEFLEPLNHELKKIDAVAVVGGSSEKKTWLSGNYDIDIFVKFDYEKYKSENLLLSNILELILKKLGQNYCHERVHGSRDYFQIKSKTKSKGYFFEIVPVLDIEKPEQAMNITDVSPMHAEWVSFMVSKNKGIEDEIRLAKQFCRANKMYGAESFILGFSGYICEILTIYYGSFISLLEASQSWDSSTIIDARKYYANKADVFKKLNKEKLKSPLIIIDPVQKDRNAAAALSFEKCGIFVEKAKEFLEAPDEKMFVREKITLQNLKEIAGKNMLFTASAKPLEGKSDVVGAKLMKIFQCICKNLKGCGFKLIDSGWEWDKKSPAMMWFIVDSKELSSTFVRTGPPKKQANDFNAFRKKHEKSYIEGGRVYAEVKREFTRPEQLFAALKKDKYINDRAKKVSIKGD